jgi:hypothetical protein
VGADTEPLPAIDAPMSSTRPSPSKRAQRTDRSHRSVRSLFLALVLAQAAHSVEEYLFRLYDVFAPARLVSALFSRNLAAGFAAANIALVSFGVWCYVARVRRGHPGRGWAWFWTVLEGANGTGHLILAASQGGYFPGAATAPFLLGLALALGATLSRPAGGDRA